MPKILIIRRASGKCGNLTTADRLRNYLEKSGIECTSHDPKEKLIDCLNEWNSIIVINAHHCTSVLKECSIPYIIIFGGTDLNEYSEDAKYLSAMQDVVIKARHLITFGPSMTEKAFALWPELTMNKLTEIPQAVCTSPSDFSLKHYLKKNFSIVAEKIFLLVSGIRPVKDPLFLVKIFSEWHNKHTDCWLIIIGSKIDECYYSYVIENINSMKGVLLIPEMTQNDLHASIKDSVSVVNSSVSEGMCSVILEAMDLSVPVLARDIPGNRDIIRNRITGLLYKTPQEFLNAAEQLLENNCLRQDLINNAKLQIHKRHNCEKESQIYVELINSVLLSSNND